jgi:hypothetical protein
MEGVILRFLDATSGSASAHVEYHVLLLGSCTYTSNALWCSAAHAAPYLVWVCVTKAGRFKLCSAILV